MNDGLWLVVGLGNPGQKYEHNRHNVGFRIVDAICAFHSFTPFRLKDFGLMAEGAIKDIKVIALKPLTYMNRSGQAIAAAARFYKIPPENILVIHDDIELQPKVIRVKQGGGHGGHNGLKDADAHIGKAYWRLRFGVGHPGHRDLVSDYVLGDFSKADETWIAPLIEGIVHAFPTLICQDAATFLNELVH